MKRIEAAGGVLYRGGIKEPEVLLIYRRGVWDLPKGKREKNESFESCAVREIAEETGVPDPNLISLIMDTYHTYMENDEEVNKMTRWYVMTPSDPDFIPVPQESEQIESVVWRPLSRALEEVGYDNLRQVLNKFEALISGPG